MVPQTLEQLIHSLAPKELARASASLLNGRPVAGDDAKDRLFGELAGFRAIQHRLELVPVREVAEAYEEAILAGGYLPFSNIRERFSGAPDAWRNLLEQYFLGTVGEPDWSPIGLRSQEPYLIAFPEITISYLRNAPVVAPRLFELRNSGGEFMAALDEVTAECRAEIAHAETDGAALRERIAEILGDYRICGDDGAAVSQVVAVVTGERLLERLAQIEHRAFRPWETLSDRERSLRVLTHLITWPADGPTEQLKRELGRRVINSVRSLEAGRWYAPGSVSFLALLETLREELSRAPSAGSGDGGRTDAWASADLAGLAADLQATFHSMLCNSGILETADSRGKTVAERPVPEGLAALSHRVDWQNWEKLKRARQSPDASGREALPDDPSPDRPVGEEGPYLDLPPGQPWECRLEQFLGDVKRLLLALISIPVPSTRKGRPVRLKFRKLLGLLGWDEEYGNLVFEFADGAGLAMWNEALGRYLPTREAVRFLDGGGAEGGRPIAAHFWQGGLDEGPISENLREVKHVFVQEFLGRAEGGQFVSLRTFWDWLSDTPAQHRVARRWSQYVDEDREILNSITLTIAQTLTRMGLADASPQGEEPEFLRLSSPGRAWLVHYRFEEPLVSLVRSSAKLAFDGNGSILAPMEMPFELLAELALLARLQTMDSHARFIASESCLAEAIRQGEDPRRLLAIVEESSDGKVPPSLAEMLERVRAQALEVELQGASGFLRIPDAQTAQALASGSDLAPQIAASAGEYLILRRGVDLAQVLGWLHERGYLVRRPAGVDGKASVLASLREGRSSSLDL